MSSIRAIQQDQALVSTVSHVITSLQEVSVTRMQKGRDAVLQSRDFMQGLISIFSDLHASYHLEVEALVKEKKQAGITALFPQMQNGKKLVLLLSPTRRFSGSLAREIFDQFSTFVESTRDTDITLVGQVGKEMFDQKFGKKRAYTFFPFDEDKLEQIDLSDFLASLGQYKQITVFAGQFLTLVTQKPAQSEITGNESLRQAQESRQENVRRFLFEPDLETIISYFRSQVLALLAEQALHESRLAHLGARIRTLESARDSVKQRAEKLHSSLIRARRQKNNRKQLARFSGMALWK